MIKLIRRVIQAVRIRRLKDQFARDLGYTSYNHYLAESLDCDAGIDEKDGFGVWLAFREANE